MIEQVITVAQMRAVERAVMGTGISEWELMRSAGEGAAQWVMRMAAGKAVTLLCGRGNNGGDGYVIAEYLRSCGHKVDVIAPLAPATETSRFARAYYKGSVRQEGALDTAIVVDCLFGYGLSRRVEGVFYTLLEKLVLSNCFKIAIDVPSAIESDSGAILGPTPQYDLTLALGAWKQAHFLMPAIANMGAKRLVSLGLPHVKDAAELAARPVIQAPAANAYKYTRGLAGIVAGSMPGAALLACQAAMRSGAGYVKLFSDSLYPNAPMELVIENNLTEGGLADKRIRALLIGPGLGRGAAAIQRLISVLESGKACVLDADALHLLDNDVLEGVDPSRIIVTPHDGELAVLCDNFGIKAQDRLSRARELHGVTGMTILSKGPDTFTVSSGNTIFFNRGSSWLSVAGSGDVLAGIVAARLACHGDPLKACEEAVWLHHEAAGQAGPAFTAGQLAHAIKPAMEAFL